MSYHVTSPHLREERDNRNTIEKKGNSFHCSFSFFFTFFFLTLLFFYPLSSSRFDEFFPFPFFVLPNFHYRGKQFLFSFFLSLSLLFFFFNLVFLSFFFSLGFWPYHVSNLEVNPFFFLSFFVTFYDFISLIIKLWGGEKFPFLFSLSPLRHLLTHLFPVHLRFQHWGREFLISFSFSLPLSLKQTTGLIFPRIYSALPSS